MAKKAQKRDSIVASTEDGSPVVEVFSLRTEGDTLIMDCKALGSMRMDVVIKAEDIARGWPVIKKCRSDIMSFGKQIPKAVRKHKKELAKAQEQEIES